MIIKVKNGFIVLTADTGNVFRSKISGDILTDRLYLGCNDSVDNYEEISEEDAYGQTETEETNTEDGVQ